MNTESAVRSCTIPAVCRLAFTAISSVNNFSGSATSWLGLANMHAGWIDDRDGTDGSLRFMMIFVWRAVTRNFLQTKRSRTILCSADRNLARERRTAAIDVQVAARPTSANHLNNMLRNFFSLLPWLDLLLLSLIPRNDRIRETLFPFVRNNNRLILAIFDAA